MGLKTFAPNSRKEINFLDKASNFFHIFHNEILCHECESTIIRNETFLGSSNMTLNG